MAIATIIKQLRTSARKPPLTFIAALGFALMSCASPANASSSSAGTVVYLVSFAQGQVLFSQSSSRTAQPACATTPGRWALDTTTQVGQTRLAMILTAYALHQPIQVIGTGACDVWGDTETVSYIVTAD